MLKSRVFLFIGLVLGGLLLAPLANTVASLREGAGPRWDRAALFNVDRPARWLNRALYAAGISTAPNQVVIGREGWLYLGDEYERTRTATRRAARAEDIARAGQVAAAARAWEDWLRRRGVRLYRVLVAPNKESIYPEHLPRWAQPAGPGMTDALAAAARATHVDVRAALRSARQQPHALYYRTDTHWNGAGAAFAFQAFAAQVGAAAPELRWPAPEAADIVSVAPRPGGDLARFLRLSDALGDLEPVTRLAVPQLEYHDFMMGAPLRPGSTELRDTRRPVVHVSPAALNRARVLWLRDSFGDALSPWMAATFSHTMQLHWNEALPSPQKLAALVERWKPDYVFVTVVERAATVGAFTRLPPGEPASAGSLDAPPR